MRRPWPRSPDDVDVVDVLLVEHDEEADAAADEVRAVLHQLALEAVAWRATWPGEPERLLSPEPPADTAPPAGLARRVARRYRRHAAVAALLAVTVAVTTAVVDARQTAARAAALAATPAVLAEASSPPAEVWRVPGRVASDQHDRLLVVDGASLRAVDPATGEVTWTASDAAGRAAARGGCFPVDEDLRPDRAPVDDGGPRGLVACVDGGGTADGPGRAVVVVVDSATGRTRRTVVPDGALLLAEPAGRDLLVVSARTDLRVRVTRWDLATGAARWDSVSPQPVLTGGPADTVERRPGSVTVAGFAVDVATGERLDAERETRAPYPYEEHLLPTGARATWAWLEDGTSGRGRGRVSGGDIGSSFTLPGPPLRPSVTDNSDGGVLVVRTARGDRLRGMDLRTGRMRWSEIHPEASASRATALVDGVMLLDEGATVSALDVRTGEGIWRTRVDDGATDGPAVTDGGVVVLPTPGADGAVRLVARRIADGVEVWSGEAPTGTVALTAVDHRMIASTGQHVVGLG